MGYQQGEIPMTNVHGQEVAGATFPVPIWHEYMAAALWNRPAIDFPSPNAYPSYSYLHKGYYGPVRYYSPQPTYTAPTTTAAQPPKAQPTKPSRPPGGSH